MRCIVDSTSLQCIGIVAFRQCNAKIDLFDSKALYFLIKSEMEEEDPNDIVMCGCK